MSPFFKWNNWLCNMSFESGINNFSRSSSIFLNICVPSTVLYLYNLSSFNNPLGWMPVIETPQRWGSQDLESHVTCLVTHQTSSRDRMWTLEMIHPFSLFAFKHTLIDFLSYPKKVSLAHCRSFNLEILMEKILDLNQLEKIIQRVHVLFPQFPQWWHYTKL